MLGVDDRAGCAAREGFVDVVVTVEVFAANGSKLPPTIVDPAWKKLSPSHLVKKKTATIKLADGGKAFRFLVLWLTKAPASSPEKVSLGELVLYPSA